VLPPRVVLNAVYAMLTDGMDRKQRDDFDAELYGWTEVNQRANTRLQALSGGED
jgi:hypothetical protein